MSKGPKITDEARRFIAEVDDKHPDWVAKQVMAEVQSMLYSIGHQVKPDWPGLSSVQNELKKLRQRKADVGQFNIDNPWSIGRLAEYDIPSEAVPKILEIQELKRDYQPLTIREVNWVGRLHAVDQNTIELAIWATLYAARERLCEYAGIEKDTSDIDPCVRSRYINLPFYFQWLFRQDWVADSYKKQVAEEQSRQYENILGLGPDVEIPQLSTNGWLVYADGLQQLLFWDNALQTLPKEIRLLRVLTLRLAASDEGRLMTSSGKYIDTIEIWRTGEFCEKLVESSNEYLISSKNPWSEFAEELQKFHDHEFTEFIRKLDHSPLLQAINRITSIAKNKNSSEKRRSR